MVILEINKDSVKNLDTLMHTYPFDLKEKGLEPNKVIKSWKVNILNKATAKLEIFTDNKYIWARMIWYKNDKEFYKSFEDDQIDGVWECPADEELNVLVNII